jgi:hypothetical protein
MSTTETPPTNTEVARCPLCDSPLIESPDQCSKCDWVKGYRHRGTGTGPVDLTACLLSIVPGAGHYYKGHKSMGWLYAGGALLAIFWCSLAATATMGMGLLMTPLYWAWVATHAYWIEDLNAVEHKQGEEAKG